MPSTPSARGAASINNIEISSKRLRTTSKFSNTKNPNRNHKQVCIGGGSLILPLVTKTVAGPTENGQTPHQEEDSNQQRKRDRGSTVIMTLSLQFYLKRASQPITVKSPSSSLDPTTFQNIIVQTLTWLLYFSQKYYLKLDLHRLKIQCTINQKRR